MRHITKIGLLSIGLSLLGTAAFGGTVKKINAKKKLVNVELGEEESVAKDDELCFFSAKGKKIGCGTVTKVKDSQAYVKVTSAKILKKIKPDMEVHAGEAKAAEASEQGASEAQGDKASSEDTEASEEAPAKGKKESKNKKQPLRITGKYIYTAIAPMTYKKLSYLAPEKSGTTTSSLWSAEGDIKSSLFGFALEVGVPLGGKSLNLGLRYRSFTPTVVDTDYIQKTTNPYLSIDEKATALGLWVDYQYLYLVFSPKMGLGLTGGLDIDMSTVTFIATKKNDATGATSELAKATSKLNTISLRLGSGLNVMVSKIIGLNFGLNLLVPLSGTATFSGSVDTAEARGVADTGKDLQTALGHKKTSMALEVLLGLVMAF